ncbi:MAG: phosphatidylserine decarboxylase family protein, partial [Elusimicrobia bacterium]|nr:phosphatidylserine decarboxylase family protein [Elusimicrobiota bacterium]
ILLFIPYSLARFLGALFLILGFFCVFFFRDPEREISSDPSVVLSPGDGKILEVTEEPSPYWNGSAKVVKIFLSIFDVHVQRSPLAGDVLAIDYHKGKFLDARHPKASSENESNSVLIQNGKLQIAVKQIAGLIARRIVCWVRKGESVTAGQRIGLIRFGSQVDLFLPKNVELCVSPGEKVVGGVSILAIIKP